MAAFAADPTDNDNLPVASPASPSNAQSVSAFARFEFEPGKGNEGTKVLMVEWEDEDVTRNTAGSWQVSWEGKSTQLHADDHPADNVRRLYFLLPPGQTIPPTVTLTYEPPPDSGATAKKPTQVTVNPLPAIFPTELGAEARQKGKKAVLHTIWAKQRLRVLEKEIQQEQDFNLEGIALEMAISERDWIQDNFGVFGQRPSFGSARSSANIPRSPRTPGGSRLNEKLKGLSLNTREEDLNRTPDVNTPSREPNLLSPESPDVAVPFFGSMRGHTPSNSSSRSIPTPPSSGVRYHNLDKTTVAKSPHSPATGAALAATANSPISRQKSSDSGDDLFAKAISPRTPAIGKSPFSFSATEVMPYLQSGGH